MDLLNLPLELQAYIVDFIDIKSTECLSMCSKQYRGILEYECIWKHKLKQLLGVDYDTIEQFNTLNYSTFENFYKVYTFTININPNWTRVLCSLGYVELFKYAYQNNDEDNLGEYLSISIKNRNYVMVKYLLDSGVIPEKYDVLESGISGDIQIAEYILELNPDYNECLLGAAIGNHIDLAKKLINKGADAFNIALGYALSRNNLQMAQYLVDKGANISHIYHSHCKTNSQRDILTGAIQGGHLETIKYMVNMGVQLKYYVDSLWWLNVALDNKYYEIVKYILQQDVKCKLDKISLPVITTREDRDIVHYMLKHSK